MKVRFFSFLAAAFSFLVAANFISCKKNQNDRIKTYTYRYISSSPSTWNPTDYQMSNEGDILGLTSMGLYDFVMNDTNDGYEIVCELAAEFPEDVTKEYAGSLKYKIPSDAEKGFAWKFELNRNACWDDGTPITADTWEYSVRQYLNPEMKNYRASNFYQDKMALVNAEAYYNGTGTWENVGFVKNNDYSFTLILTKAQSLFMIEYCCSGATLVKEDLYEKNKKPSGELIKSSYCTSVETAASCGPYKVKNFQPDKQITLERNEKWYGWTDGNHENQFMTTNIEISFVDEHATILNLFLQGKLDETGLDSNDLKRYGNSLYRQITPSSNTWRYTFNSDKASLEAENLKGENHSILAYKDFRHGISLSLERQKYVDTLTPASDAGFGLINYAYVSNPEANEIYRETSAAKKILCELYKTDSVEDITGFNKEEAKYYLLKAYNEALDKKDILPEDKIQIDVHTYAADEIYVKSVSFLQDGINDVVAGTVLENKIFFKQVTDPDYYANLKKGKVDCAMTSWGGGTYDPFGVMWCYTDPDALQEFGFNSKQEKLTIKIEGKEITKTFFDWYIALCEGEYSDAAYELRTEILAQMEKGILEQYCTIPLRYYNSVGLTSQRIIEKSETYGGSLVGYGGLRFMKFSMDDAEWEEYCSQQNNQLKY